VRKRESAPSLAAREKNTPVCSAVVLQSCAVLMGECSSCHSQTSHVSGSHASRENREHCTSQRRGLQIEQQDRASIITQNRTSSVELVKNRTRVLFINDQRTTCVIVRISQMIVMWKSRRWKCVSAAADLRERARVAGGEEEGANRDRTRESYERTLSRGFPPPRSDSATERCETLRGLSRR
jgi:hypothetical protein